MAKKDYYQLLGVARGASTEDIRKQFRKLALELHPDRNKEKGAADKFKEVNEAYQILIDPEKRARYDQFGHAGVGPQAGYARDFEGVDLFGGLGDLFDSFFGGGFSTAAGRASSARNGENIRRRVELNFEDAYYGAEREITFDRMELCGGCGGSRAEPGTSPTTCPTCRGTGQVRRSQKSLFGQFVQVAACSACRGEGSLVDTPCSDCKASGLERRPKTLSVKAPPGIEHGMTIRITGEGNVGLNGGRPGDLLVSVSVRPHPALQREGADLVMELPINYAQAVLGAELTVPLITGDETLQTPAGAQPGKVFVLKGKGMPRLGQRGHGDVYVKVKLEIPRKLGAEQREALQNLSETMGWEDDNSRAKEKGLFNKVKDAFTNA